MNAIENVYFTTLNFSCPGRAAGGPTGADNSRHLTASTGHFYWSSKLDLAAAPTTAAAERAETCVGINTVPLITAD